MPGHRTAIGSHIAELYARVNPKKGLNGFSLRLALEIEETQVDNHSQIAEMWMKLCAPDPKMAAAKGT